MRLAYLKLGHTKLIKMATIQPRITEFSEVELYGKSITAIFTMSIRSDAL